DLTSYIDVSIIRNTTSPSDQVIVIPDDEVLTVDKKYGYRIEITDPTLLQIYVPQYVAEDGDIQHLSGTVVPVDANTSYYNPVVVRQSLIINKKEVSFRKPLVTVVYSDENTVEALKEKIAQAILGHADNIAFFTAAEAAGFEKANSFEVIFTLAESPVPVGDNHSYTVTFPAAITENIEITGTGQSRVSVTPATLLLTLADDYEFAYKTTVAEMEAAILAKFLEDNADVLGGYSYFTQHPDLFRIVLYYYSTGDPLDVGSYNYQVQIDEAAATNFTLTGFSPANVGGTAILYTNVKNSVNVVKKQIELILPTYLGDSDNGAAKAAFFYGKKTRAQIQKIIKADIIALNSDKIEESEYDFAITLWQSYKPNVNPGKNPSVGTYLYRIADLEAGNYTFTFAPTGHNDVTIDDQAVDPVYVTNAVKVKPTKIEAALTETDIAGIWSINVDNIEYHLDPSAYDTGAWYGWYQVNLTETPDDLPLALSAEGQWNELFTSGKLNWALYDQSGTEVFRSERLDNLLVDLVKASITEGVFTVRLVNNTGEQGTVIGNYDFVLNVGLATLTVTAAEVAIAPAEPAYTKTYGVQVIDGTELDPALTFAPTLGSKILLNTDLSPTPVDAGLFKTVSAPTGVTNPDVYLSTAPVGEYAIQTDADKLNLLTPVVGVKYVASSTTATVTIEKLVFNDGESITLQITREYGELWQDEDVTFDIAGIGEPYRTEILTILNGEDGRQMWADIADLNNRQSDVGIYDLRLTTQQSYWHFDAVEAIQALLANFGFAIPAEQILPGKAVILPAPLTIITEDCSRPYGAANPQPVIVYKGLKNSEEGRLEDVFRKATGSVLPIAKITAGADARGRYPVEIINKNDLFARNYTITYEEGWMQIDKIKRWIVWPESERNLVIAVGETVELSAYILSEVEAKPSVKDIRYTLYNNEREPVLLYKEGDKYFVKGQSRTLSNGATGIEVSAPGDDTYEAVASVWGTVTVVEPEGDATHVSITVSNVTSVYDGTPKAVNAQVVDTQGGTVEYAIYYEGDTGAEVPTTYAKSRNAPVEVGVYAVSVVAKVANNEYTYYAKNKMVILPRTVTVRADNVAVTYGEYTAKQLEELVKTAYSYDRNDFLAGLDFPAANPPVVTIEGYKGNAGEYRLLPYSSHDFGRNYSVDYQPGTLTVKQAALTITADSKKTVYGQPLAALTCSYNGLVQGEAVANLGFTPRILIQGLGDAHNAGTYTITFDELQKSVNYAVTYKNGVYTIEPASQQITWNQSLLVALPGGAVALTATVSSGLPLTFTSSDFSVAYVNNIDGKWILTPVSIGEVTITARQGGDANHYAATPVEKVVKVAAGLTGVEAIAAGGIAVYPTLFTGTITVLAASPVERIDVVTFAGATLKVIEKPASTIDLSSLSRGNYLLRVTLEDGTSKTVKVVKK
ncbi:MAG: T9SS type A sorting domain-containing protein, partial [Tannerellaceae bacterium]|nr:T9SS type A sorting domain-containing protein [Tannerellaceae bacterium]